MVIKSRSNARISPPWLTHTHVWGCETAWLSLISVLNLSFSNELLFSQRMQQAEQIGNSLKVQTTMHPVHKKVEGKVCFIKALQI